MFLLEITASHTHRGRHSAAKAPPHSVSVGDRGGPLGRKWRELSEEGSKQGFLIPPNLTGPVPAPSRQSRCAPNSPAAPNVHLYLPGLFPGSWLSVPSRVPLAQPLPLSPVSPGCREQEVRLAMGRVEGHIPLARSLQEQPSYP